MNELKTLKDFEQYCVQDFISNEPPRTGNYDAIVNFYKLKQGAIKWVKQINKLKCICEYRNFCKINFKTDDWIYLDDDTLKSNVLALGFGYKHFFNITEEDLK